MNVTPKHLGYSHPHYARSLQEFGQPIELPSCGGWILERQIPGTIYKDAMGCYPLFTCNDWVKIIDDLEDIGTNLTSLALVTDPFGDYDEALLRHCFKEVVIPFKQHFIIDLSQSPNKFASKHHIRYARKALAQLIVEKCETPLDVIDSWVNLYKILTERHNIKGVSAFSRNAFVAQLEVPGIHVFRAIYNDETLGMILCYIENEVGYYHLGAYNSCGYEMRASFALFWFIIEYFASIGLRWLNLGAGAGIGADGKDGLSTFKRGWATGTRTAYFCGKILDPQKYAEIVKAKGTIDTEFFPAYRKGEFE